MKDPRKMKLEKELKDAMVSNGAGLGTPATRDNIIENIIARGYVTRKGKQLFATDLAVNLIEVSPEELKSPEITADWEQKLADVSNGKINKETFMQEIKQYIENNIVRLKETELSVNFAEIRKAGEKTDYNCPKCSSPITYLSLKNHNLYVCSKDSKEAPCMTVFETQFSKKLTKSQIKTLFEKGATSVIEGLKSKSGKKFKAALTFDLENLRLKPMFEDSPRSEIKKSEVQCPFCGEGFIQENSKAFGCSNWQNKCKFTVWKNGSTITMEIVERLIADKETPMLTLNGPGNKPYKAKYTLDIEGKKIDREYGK
jgi:DNA topoisomerase III